MFSPRFSTRLLAGTAIALVLNVPAFADNAVPAEQQVAAADQPTAPLVLKGVTVEGQATTENFKVDTTGLNKLTEPVRDTPQTITTISKEVMEERGVTNFNDAMKSVPGITLGAGEFNWQGNNPNIRGFNARTDMFLDGMRDFGNYYRDPFNLEQISVLEGPASMVFGRGSTGGVVSSITKEANLTPSISGSMVFGTDDTKRVTADVNEPLPELGEGAAVRLNVMGHDSAVADRDVGHQDRWAFAPSLALGLGTSTRIVLDYLHQSANDIPDYGLPWFGTVPAAVPRNNFYGFDSDYQKTQVDIITAKVDHDFSDDLTLHTQLRYGHYDRDNRISEPQVTAAVGTAPASVTAARNVYTGQSEETNLWAQSDLTAKLQTGFLQHTIVAGVEGGNERSAPTIGFAQGVPGTNLLTPSEHDFFVSTGTPPSLIADTMINSIGVYAMDTIKINEMFQVVGGIRWDDFHTHYSDSRFVTATGVFTGSDRITHTDREFSYRVGAVFKPMEEGSIYINYGNSFNPSDEALTFVTSARGAFPIANAFLAPEENHNYEIGAKWDFFGGKLSANAAVFRIDKENARVPTATPNVNTLGGTQRSQGFDIGVTGAITDRWQIMAGYEYLDPKVIAAPAIAGAPAVGAPLPFAPKGSATFWTSYMITNDIQVGVGGQHQSMRFAQNTAPLKWVPGFWTFDAMAKYNFSEHLALQVNLNNLTDKYYFDAIHQQHIIPGAGRTALFTIKVNY